MDQVKTKKREDGAESYESVVCSIENDFAKQSEVRIDTRRLDQFCGTKKLSTITEGRYTDITDPEADNSCVTWTFDSENSEIDNESDGREMVTCQFYRDSINTNSDINFLRENTIHYYAGYNVFEDENSQYILSGGSSTKLEMRMLEEAGALSGL